MIERYILSPRTRARSKDRYVLLRRPHGGGQAAAQLPPDPAATAYFAAVQSAGGNIPAARQTLYNILFTNLRTAGCLAVLDRLWIFAAPDSATALLDLIGLQTAGNINNMVFTPDRGFASDGSATELLVTNYNPTTNAVHYARNSAHQSFYINTIDTTADTSAGNYDQGAGVDSHNFIAYNDATFPINGSFVVAINMNSANGLAYGSGLTTGFFLGDRNGATSTMAIANNTLLGTNPAASVVPSSNQFYVAAVNNNGNPIILGKSRFAMYSTGGSFGTSAAGIAFGSIIKTFLAAIGAS